MQGCSSHDKSAEDRWILFTGPSALEQIEADWRMLEAAESIGSPFDRFDFANACTESGCCDARTLLVPAWIDRNEIRKILPLRVIRQLGTRVALPINAPLAQYAPSVGSVLSHSKIRLLMRALSESNVADLLFLRRVRADSGLRNARTMNETISHPPLFAPSIDLRAFGSFDVYEESFSTASRRNRRQRRQKVERQFGDITFEVYPGREAIDLVQKACQWKRKWLFELGLTSAVLDDGVFEKSLLACSEMEGAWVSVLRVGRNAAALELGFSSNSHYVAYLGAFDPAFSRFSLGQEQMARTIEWCFAKGFQHYDLLAPEDSYKKYWSRGRSGAEVRDIALPLNLRGRTHAILHRQGSRLKRVIPLLPQGVQRVIFSLARQ
jgi:CelD/BcsL family acetyltransferase involved in cellulose biosynthesis